ncbi:hypothetical protein [Methyloversatilis sp.]|uniref:hypothetical protein n=1 Tax=Methyloversatilis sp. TaxID=2569862 RepID=UPI0035AE6A57
MSDLMALINQKRKELNKDRQKTIKPADGRGRYRILPSWRPEGGQFWHDFGQHYIKDAMGKVKAVYVCTERTFGKPCGVCEAMLHAQQHVVDDETMKLIQSAKANGRVLVNALHLDGATPDVPQILELSPTTFSQFLAIVQEWGSEVLDLTEGKDVIIEKTGKGLETKYSIQIAAKSKPVDSSVMTKVANLDDYVAQESEEQQRRAISNLNMVAGVIGNSVPATSPRDLPLSAPPHEIDETLDIPMTSAASSNPVSADAELEDLLESLGGN